VPALSLHQRRVHDAGKLQMGVDILIVLASAAAPPPRIALSIVAAGR